MNQTKRNIAIDGIRALAVWSVFLYHLGFTALSGGFVGVDVFFLISGYVVCGSLLRSPRVSLPQLLTAFYFRRVLRIYPPLVACLVPTGVMARMFIPPSFLAGNSDKTGHLAFWGLSNFELAANHNTYFGVLTDFNPYVHTWSLAVEEQFYLVFPVLFFLSRTSGATRKAAAKAIAHALMPTVVIASFCISMYQSHFSRDSAFFMLPSRFWELGTGVLLSLAHEKKLLLPRTNWQAFSSAALGLGLICLSAMVMTGSYFPSPGAIAPVAGTALLISGVALGTSDHTVKRVLENSTCVYFGRISYSLYLWHWPVIVLLRWTTGIESVAAISLAIVATTILAVLSYHLIEVPCQRAGGFQGREFSVSVFVSERDNRRTVLSCPLSPRLFVVLGSALAVFFAQKMFDRVVNTQRLPLSVTTRQADGFNCWRNLDPAFVANLKSPRKLFIIGDSHAGSYWPLGQLLDRGLGLSVIVRTEGGITFASLVHRQNAEDQKFVDKVMDELRQTANRGDAVLLSSLRMKRLCDQWCLFDREAVLRERDSQEAEEERLVAVEEGIELIRKLQAIGLEVIIEAPTPILPAPAFRCCDWFNKWNPVGKGGLTISRDFLLEHREPAMKSIDEVRRRLPDTHVWDPFFVLCPGDVFEGLDGDRPILFDGDHLTPYGTQKLYPSFRDFLIQLWAQQ